jgi:SAM-dependent methyltransferase
MKKTERDYWDGQYERRTAVRPVPLSPPLSRCDLVLQRIFTRLELRAKSVLEIGGGGSAWLARLAVDNPQTSFTCVDYSPQGCALTRQFVSNAGLNNLRVIEADVFEGPLGGEQYDVVYSFGVVEHFDDLAHIMRAIAAFARPHGRIFTLIPNMAGALGWLTRLYNRSVYDIHVPHDLVSFERGHREAGLQILEDGYIGSSNFGVLSSCFERPKGAPYQSYVWLTRLTKVAEMFEERVFELPTSAILSPYIYAISTPD